MLTVCDYMTQRKNAKEQIVKILRKHPEGLMLIEIAKLTGMNRLTVAKYIHELIGKRSVFQRRVAAARVCYLREHYPNNDKDNLLSGEK